MEKEQLRQTILDQQEFFRKNTELINREINLNNYLKGNEIIIITGIRRCGKSSLLKIISDKINKAYIYINFDDIKINDFEVKNFEDIEEISSEIHGKKEIIYFLDEIQNIHLWEKWVNNLYSKNIKVFVTGSNSNLLSSEISTFLTGRNKVIKLSPFSFKEFLNFKKINVEYKTTEEKRKVVNSFNEYFEIGGFPLIIKNNDLELSKQYFEDILNKDLIKRYGIKKIKELNDLIIYLFSNIGVTYSYSTLKLVSGIKSLSMIKNYIDYLKNVFLVYTINRFDFSIKKQKISSSKIYVLDNSFLKTVGFNFSENLGRRLENLVFIELLRKNQFIYYHSEKFECDFVIKEGLKITKLIQVALNLDNLKLKQREINGLLEAMGKYKLNECLILTLETEDLINLDGKKIIIKPVWKWLLE